MYWIEMEQPEGKRIQKWQRSAAITDEGVVFVPGAIAGSEHEVMLCAAYDGTSVINRSKAFIRPSKLASKRIPRNKRSLRTNFLKS